MDLKWLRSPWLPGVLLVALAIPAGQSLLALQDARDWNRRIAGGKLADLPEGGMPAEALIGRAADLDARGDVEGALNLYKRIEEQPGNPYAKDAAFDAATIYLRRAVAAGGPASDPQTIPLVELAKEGYRNLLRQDPQNWEARYNLDRALRLMPEDDDEDSGGGAPPIGAERAPTTMRGFTLGLP